MGTRSPREEMQIADRRPPEVERGDADAPPALGREEGDDIGGRGGEQGLSGLSFMARGGGSGAFRWVTMRQARLHDKPTYQGNAR